MSSTYPLGQADEGRVLLQRVRKLMDKASSTSNSHEADAFARKAAELVARHRIDPDRVADIDDQNDLAVREIPLGRGAYVRARLALLMAVAATHDTRVVFGTTPNGTVAHVAGHVSDLDVVELMYHSLHAQAAARVASQRRATPAATQRYRRSFLFGFADRMGVLLADTRRDAEAAVVAAATDGRAATNQLAIVDRTRRVDEFAKESFGRVRTARAPGPAQANGWRAGSAAADRADVGRARLTGRRALGSG
ncbi:MAG TPA: DUF2786 domain-containing protein [Ilumatobacteraceae bacterium]|nr:DUF2786 domain-containing protein [Ilumatobacteraceae bacterium]